MEIVLLYAALGILLGLGIRAAVRRFKAAKKIR